MKDMLNENLYEIGKLGFLLIMIILSIKIIIMKLDAVSYGGAAIWILTSIALIIWFITELKYFIEDLKED